MENNIYLTYSKLSLRFGSTFSYPNDSTCIYDLKKHNFDFNEYEIKRVGSYSIESGNIVPIEPVTVNPTIADSFLGGN